jgi:hypothetical protein
MTKKNNEEETIEYVYIPDEGVYGTIVRYGAWASMIEYYDTGVKYTVEIPNDEYIVVDEIGVGYLEESIEGMGYPDEEEEDL